MKKIIHAFLVILLVIGCTTCKKENVEKELPELIGNWQFYGASYPVVCSFSNGRLPRTRNIDFIDNSLLPLDGSYKIEVKKRKIIFTYLGKNYVAFIDQGNIQKDISLNNYYVDGEQIILFDYMGYIPGIPTAAQPYYVNSFTIRTELNYKAEKFSENKEIILIKIIVDWQGSKREFLQVLISDIRGTTLVQDIPEYIEGIYSCGGHKSMTILTFEKI